MTRTIVGSIEEEFRRYKALGEKSLAQVPENEFKPLDPGCGNSLVVLVQHISGNLKSRFTDFLTSDGEKPWRNRDAEFSERALTRADLMQLWNEGWQVLFDALTPLSDTDLSKQVTIRGKHLSVIEALHRSLAHIAHHVGQIVYLAKYFCGERWITLSIAVGSSKHYKPNPARERL